MKRLVILFFLFAAVGAGIVLFFNGKRNRLTKNFHKQKERVGDARFAVVLLSDDNESLQKQLQSFQGQTYSKKKLFVISKEKPLEVSNMEWIPSKGHPERALLLNREKLHKWNWLVFLKEKETLASPAALQRFVDLAKKAPHKKLLYGFGANCAQGVVNSFGAVEETFNLPPFAIHASLFKHLSLKDCLEKGKFIQGGLLSALIKKGYSSSVSIQEQLVLGATNLNLKRSKRCFDSDDYFYSFVPTTKADLIIFSYNRPLQLQALLESIEKHVTGLNQAHVLYRADDLYQKAYEKVQNRYPQVHFVQQNQEMPRKYFKRELMDILQSSQSSFVLFAVDDQIVVRPTDLENAAKLMQKTKAYAFCFRLGLNTTYSYMENVEQGVPTYEEISEEVFAYEFGSSIGDWAKAHSVDMTLFPREFVIQSFLEFSFHDPSQIENTWCRTNPKKEIGLFPKHSTVVNVPLNLVSNVAEKEFKNRNMGEYSTEELLEIFNRGYKIDIRSAEESTVRSAHSEIDLEFIEEQMERNGVEPLASTMPLLRSTN